MDNETQCVGAFVKNGMLVPRVWANPPYSFDHIGAAFLTLLQIVALKGWIPILNSATDLRGVGLQPKPDSRPVNNLYFIAFIFVASFYMMRLFVGIIVAHFRQFSGTALLTPAQQRWVATRRTLATVKPVAARPKPISWAPSWARTLGRGAVYDFVMSRVFEPIVTVVIITHLMFLATQSSGQSSVRSVTPLHAPRFANTRSCVFAFDCWCVAVRALLLLQNWTEFLSTVHWVYTGIYIFELLLRAFALGAIGSIRHVWIEPCMCW